LAMLKRRFPDWESKATIGMNKNWNKNAWN